MKRGAWIATVAVLLVAAVCIRLGIWQLARWNEKRVLRAQFLEALAAPAVPLTSARSPLAQVRGRKVEARGRYDASRHVALQGRAHEGSPGVDVVTPLVLADSTVVLVDRGWMYANDAATVRPQDHPEPGERVVVGVAEEMRRGAGGLAMRTLESDSATVWSARWLDRDSLAARLPYAIAPYVLRQLPGPGVPDAPRRRPAEAADPFTHLSYAIQWFLFAAILLVGSALLARSRRRSSPPVAPERQP
jgi:surfeit locus 1 family protein